MLLAPWVQRREARSGTFGPLATWSSSCWTRSTPQVAALLCFWVAGGCPRAGPLQRGRRCPRPRHLVQGPAAHAAAARSHTSTCRCAGFAASCKTVFVMALLRDLVAGGHRTLVFSQSRVM